MGQENKRRKLMGIEDDSRRDGREKIDEKANYVLKLQLYCIVYCKGIVLLRFNRQYQWESIQKF